MNPFINQQNKKHSSLHKEQDKLFNADGNITWLDIFIISRADLLNRRISKLSPRKSKLNSKNSVKPKFDDLTDCVKELMDNGDI